MIVWAVRAGVLLALLIPASALAAGEASPGETLYGEHCASCHGFAGRGTSSRGPSLRGVGAAAADFYLTTGRMPISHPTDVPTRTRPAYSAAEIDRIVAYVASLGGPAIPVPHPEQGDLSEGMHAFTAQCAGCHQITGRGGILPTTGSPALLSATPTQIAEAVRVGPYLMPRFAARQLSDHELDSVIRYLQSVRSPSNAGGLGIGNTGPVPEGAVGWLVGALSLAVVARALGKGRP
jgi:ubiquinol-cytochrome c reductase cytochrome c subunit